LYNDIFTKFESDLVFNKSVSIFKDFTFSFSKEETSSSFLNVEKFLLKLETISDLYAYEQLLFRFKYALEVLKLITGNKDLALNPLFKFKKPQKNELEPDRFRFYTQPNNYILYTVILGVFFLCCQIFEYNIALFTLQDSAYGSVFYMLTGLHGFHVYVGMTALFGCYISRLGTPLQMYGHRVGFDGSIWY
jgi:hypothetical protein